MRAKPGRQCWILHRRNLLLCSALAFAVTVWGQSQGVPASTPAAPLAPSSSKEATPDSRFQFEGLPVLSVRVEGVSADRLRTLNAELAQSQGAPLRNDDLKRDLRQLYATGLFETIEVEAARQGNGVALVFRGTPRSFIGRVSVNGARGATINTQLERASQLSPGTRFTETKLHEALEQMQEALVRNGYNDSEITHTLTSHPEDQLVDIAFQVVSGPQARVGPVEVAGEPGMSVDEFRRHAHLRTNSKVDHDTTNRALNGVLKYYQKQQRLEAEIKLESQKYNRETRKEAFHFSANRGPVVKILVQGASIGPERLKHVIPVFEEGTVDEDLLNEGNRRLREYYQRLGYFDVKVDHQQRSASSEQVEILFNVQLGQRRRVERVSVSGNRYFDAATLEELLSVHGANYLDRHGAYSQALVAADIGALQAVYQNNGFPKVHVFPETSTDQDPPSSPQANAARRVDAAHHVSSGKAAPLNVNYRIEEGEQVRVGAVRLEGNNHVDPAQLTPLINTVAGQLFSPRNLAGDRDTLLTEYLSRGFDQVRIEVSEEPEQADAGKIDVVFHIHEGQQIFVRKVLLTGLHYTRPDTIARAIALHPGDPLNQTALQETQRNLYEFALFNEIETAVENPNGGESSKTVLLQTTEARRWTLTYGFGFEAQTGTPQNNCAGAAVGGVACNPNGKTGVSPRVLADVTRNNLFGREQSASIQGTYGLLEQRINFLFQNPHFEGNRNFGLTFSAGYANSQDVTTYVASKLEGGMRWTQHFNTPGSGISKANTFIYELSFRRVKVDASSLQVWPGAIASLSTATRVAGPGFTWIRDTRDSPLDARRGTYTSLQEFLSGDRFGAETNFNRLDVSNSSYYAFNKGQIVLARNTRYGQERAFGPTAQELIPLPERLYGGGPTSLRGFSINAAGPRDPETGYPVGGAGALINSTELRLPPPILPWVGNTVSFVLFHDMGNIFTNAGDAWTSAIRIHQPDRKSCENPIARSNPATPPSGQNSSTGEQGSCSFNYFSHAPGLGLRYHTPVGPIRLDFSYNLNPPIYPVTYDYSHPLYTPHVGEAEHFNFIFSLGQTF